MPPVDLRIGRLPFSWRPYQGFECEIYRAAQAIKLSRLRYLVGCFLAIFGL